MDFHVAEDLIPELILLLGGMVCAGIGAGRPGASIRLPMSVAGLTLVAAAGSCLVCLKGMPSQGYSAYSAGLIVDRFSLFVAVTVCGFALITVLSTDTLGDQLGPNAGEYFALVLTATLGAVLLPSAREMIRPVLAPGVL